MTTNHTTVIAVPVASAAVAIFGHLAVAHADSYYNFQSPTGNVACEMIGAADGTGAAVCKLQNHLWSAPPATGRDCEFAGGDWKLFQGNPPCAGVWPSQIFLQQADGSLPILAYGQTHTVGTVTCESASSGVRCTDASTGHFFVVSQESYQFG